MTNQKANKQTIAKTNKNKCKKQKQKQKQKQKNKTKQNKTKHTATHPPTQPATPLPHRAKQTKNSQSGIYSLENTKLNLLSRK